MTNLLNDLVKLLYPNLCMLCGRLLVRDEQFLCLHCHCNIPKTNYHYRKGNPVRDLFAGYPQVNEATAYLFFEKEGTTQKLIHSLKYNGNKALALYLGRVAALELKAEGVFASVDTIIPVPLHPKKEKKRGYNQSEWIAKAFASVYECNMDANLLKRTTHTQSQTLKSVYDRHVNVENIFEPTDPYRLFKKHILLIDDVITTGATISSCIDALLSIPDITISIFALSTAREF